MQIIDPNMLLPDKQVLQDVVQKHPLHSNLAGHVETVEVFLSERFEIPHECIETEAADHKVRLGLGRSSINKTNFRYILYHEFGHVADRLRPEFKYSEQLKASLSDSEKMAVMELWNLSIDARLNMVGLFDLGILRDCYSKKHGWLPSTVQGKLQGHAVMLENQGIPYDTAMKLAEDCWSNPPHTWTYEQMIAWVKKNTGEPSGAPDRR